MLINKKDNIDTALFNEKSLNLLNIRDLRDIGRKFGIPSPTTMKKQELIIEILKIVYGEIEVPNRKNCGRPSVREFNIQKYIQKIRDNSDMADEISRMTLGKDYGELMVSDKTVQYDDEKEIAIRVFYTDGQKCYLRVCEFVASDGDIEVSKEFANRFKLENLDVIEILENGGMFKIISINGEKMPDKFKDFVVCGKPIKGGQNQDFYLSTNEEIDLSIREILEQCKKNKTKLVVLSHNEYLKENVFCISYKNTEEKSSIYKKIINLVNVCTREVLNNEDIVVVIESPDEIMNILKGFDEDVQNRMKKYLEDMLLKIIKLGNILITFKKEEKVEF